MPCPQFFTARGIIGGPWGAVSDHQAKCMKELSWDVHQNFGPSDYSKTASILGTFNIVGETTSVKMQRKSYQRASAASLPTITNASPFNGTTRHSGHTGVYQCSLSESETFFMWRQHQLRLKDLNFCSASGSELATGISDFFQKNPTMYSTSFAMSFGFRMISVFTTPSPRRSRRNVTVPGVSWIHRSWLVDEFLENIHTECHSVSISFSVNSQVSCQLYPLLRKPSITSRVFSSWMTIIPKVLGILCKNHHWLIHIRISLV